MAGRNDEVMSSESVRHTHCIGLVEVMLDNPVPLHVVHHAGFLRADNEIPELPGSESLG